MVRAEAAVNVALKLSIPGANRRHSVRTPKLGKLGFNFAADLAHIRFAL